MQKAYRCQTAVEFVLCTGDPASSPAERDHPGGRHWHVTTAWQILRFHTVQADWSSRDEVGVISGMPALLGTWSAQLLSTQVQKLQLGYKQYALWNSGP